jgi:cytochrome c5
MKKIVNIAAALMGAFFFMIMISTNVSGQTTQKAASEQNAMPADVSKILTNSCGHCHMDPGSSMAQAHLNLTKWDTYDKDKQGSKAADINKMISKGKMPPKGYAKDNPDKVPDATAKKIISDWANSLQPPKK